MMLLAALAVAGCGGDDGGEDPAPAAVAADDPANVLPPGAPVVVSVASDLDSEQVQSALAFAERVEPSDRDLDEALRSELESGDISFESDIQPWLGDTGMLALDGVMGDEPTGVAAAKTTDEAAAQEVLDRAIDESTERTYKGVTYALDNDDQSANGIVDGFVVAASDEAHFKQAVDAAQGTSLADDAQFRETFGRAPEERLGAAYVDVDGVIELIEQSGQVPPGTFDQVDQIPGFEPGSTLVVALVAEEDQMTLETVSSEPLPEGAADGPDIAELPGDPWLALASPIMGEQFLQGFNQGVAASGIAGAEQILESVGLPRLLEGLESLALRFGGESITAINGELTLGGSDAAAAEEFLTKVSPFAQQAASSNGVQLQTEDNGLSAQFGPYEISVTTDGGDLSVRVGNEPDGSLGDQEGFQTAQDALGIDDGTTVAFVDFEPLGTFLESLPQDPEMEQVMAVVAELGVLAFGTGEQDGHAVSRAVLSLR